MSQAQAEEKVSGLAAAALDLLPQSVYIVDRDFTVVAWNARREQGPLGLARSRALGRNLRDVLSPAGYESVLPALHVVRDTGAVVDQKRVTHDRRTFRVRRLPITGGGGHVTHLMMTAEEMPRVAGALAAAEAATSLAQQAVADRRADRDGALSGVIPVCAWCKKIRDRAGEWHQLEAFLASRFLATFTHGICDSCSAGARRAPA